MYYLPLPHHLLVGVGGIINELFTPQIPIPGKTARKAVLPNSNLFLLSFIPHFLIFSQFHFPIFNIAAFDGQMFRGNALGWNYVNRHVSVLFQAC
jgi:hypothetical protein